MPLINHRFAAGQRWKNPDFTLYVLACNDDYLDADGNRQPGKICVSESPPFPGRSFTATDLHPAQMENVIAQGKYQLMDEGWHKDFMLQKKAQDDARAASGVEEKVVEKPKLSGLGIATVR